MGAMGIIREREHRERVNAKQDDVATLKALRDTHLMKFRETHPTIMRLNRRIKKLENQLKNMRP